MCGGLQVQGDMVTSRAGRLQATGVVDETSDDDEQHAALHM
jgi:hypothetical protein